MNPNCSIQLFANEVWHDVASPFFIEGLRAMAPTLARLAQEGEVFGLEPDAHAFLARGMANHANALAALR